MTRRYSLLGLECTVLEVQKLAWFIALGAEATGVEDPLKLSFTQNIYGPYRTGCATFSTKWMAAT